MGGGGGVISEGRIDEWYQQGVSCLSCVMGREWMDEAGRAIDLGSRAFGLHEYAYR